LHGSVTSFMPTRIYFSPPEGATGVSVTQTKGPVSVSEGEGLRLNCSYDAAVYAVFWYVHLPSQPPRLLLRDVGRDDSDEGIRKGFDATHDKKDKSFHLWKPSSEQSDSATYYCAASDTVTRTGRGAAQKPQGLCGASWRRHRGLGGEGRNGANTELGSDLSGHRLDPIHGFTFVDNTGDSMNQN
uniref:Ig-like domain-containing protein n=1 Tax=Chrysemys picta bellii TaxID=8478 RepID=A0A8C3HQ18_CHRPI